LLNLPFSSPTFGSAVAIVALLAWRLIFHVMPALGMFRSSEGGDDACAIRREGGAPNRSVVAAQDKIFIAGSMAKSQHSRPGSSPNFRQLKLA
jgi:hypothetical protein